MRDISSLKLAFIGVSHWHVPLYLRAIKKYNLNVVAVSDDNIGLAEKTAAALGCSCFAGSRELLENTKPDFIFAFGRHCDMPELAKVLIRKGIPFAVEKPLGMRSADVSDVIDLTTREGVFCSIPFVWRYSDLVKDLLRKIASEDILHMSFKFIAGPPQRYEATSPWMLDKKTAGGGCMTNLGVHFIDLALLLTRSSSAEILGAGFHYSRGYDIEDYAVSLMKLPNGATLELETGYAYPMDASSKRDNLWNIVTKKGYYSLGPGYFESREFSGEIEKIEMDTDSDSYYSVFVHSSLNEYVRGESPTAGLYDMLNARRVLDGIIAKAGTTKG